MPNCHWVVSNHLPGSHSTCMQPLHYNDLFDMWHGEGCVTYHWVVSINRPSGYEPDALPLRHNDWGVSLGGFDPPPLGLLVCDHYTTNWWFRSTSSNLPVCDHTLQRRVLIYAPIHLLMFPSHISVTAFTVSIFPFFQTFGKYIVFQTDNFLQLVINITFDMCPSVAHICHRLHYVPINHINDFLPCGIYYH